MQHDPRRAHGILSFEDPSVSDYADYIDDFMDEIGARHKIISSWINANTAFFPWSDQPYGIVYHTENANDRLRKPSEGISLTADVSSSNFSYSWRDSGGQTGTDGFGGDVEEKHIQMEVTSRGMKKTQEVRVGGAPNGLQKIRIDLHHFDITELVPEFTLVRKYKSGMFKMSKDISLDSKGISREQAVEVAREFVKELPLPENAVMVEPASVYLDNPESPVVTMAYTIGFIHPYRGCLLAGDHITLIVQAEGIKTVSAYWHDVTVAEGRHDVAGFTNEDLKSSLEALRRFYPGLQEVPDVRYIRPIYYAFDESKEPRVVWEVYFEAGRRVFWDATAKQAPNYFEHIKKQRKELIIP